MSSATEYESNVWKFYIAKFLSTFWFIIPISVLYLLSFGLSYEQIALIYAASWITQVILEIPTGVFADIIGKKWSAFIGYILWAAALLTIGLGNTFLVFFIGFLFWGVGDAFLSGATDSLFYDSVKRIGKEKIFLKFKGRLMLIGSLSIIIGSISGGLLYGIDKRFPWIAYGLSCLIVALFVSSMKEPFKSGKGYTIANQIRHIKESVSFSMKHKQVRWLIIFSILISLPTLIFVDLAEQPYLISVGYTIAALGAIFALTRGIIGLISLRIYRIEKYLGEKASFYLVTTVYSVAFVLLGMIKLPIVLVFMVMIFLARDYKDVIIEKYINTHISPSHRATVLSFKSLATSLSSSAFALVGGFLLDILSINTVLMILGAVTFATVIPYLIAGYRK